MARRPLYAGHSALEWPDPESWHLTLWHGFTLLREFRGDSHIGVLTAHGIDGGECALLLTAAALGGCNCHSFLRALGVTNDVDTPTNPEVSADRERPVHEKRAALARLMERGLLTDDAAITSASMELRLEMERVTDAVSTSPVDNSDPGLDDRLAELIAEPVARLRSQFNLAVVGQVGSVSG